VAGWRRRAAREAELCGGRAASDGEEGGAGGQRPVPSDGGRRSWILAASGGRGLGGGRSGRRALGLGPVRLCGARADGIWGGGRRGSEELGMGWTT